MPHVMVVQYGPDELDDFLEAYSQELPFNVDRESPAHRAAARKVLDDPKRLTRAIRGADDGVHLGYVDVRDTGEDVWELGIFVLEGHRGRGVGTAALRAFLDEVVGAYGPHRFSALIEPSNEASKALFRGVGARLTGRSVVGEDIDLGFGPTPIETTLRGEGVDDEGLLAKAREADELLARKLRLLRRDVETFEFTWPRVDAESGRL